MYLLQDSRLSAPNMYHRTSALTQGRQKALLSLIRSFCRLVNKIENDPEYTHKLSGKSPPGAARRLVRRNVDFLLTCLLNASSWQREVSFEYAITFGIVQKVFRSPPRIREVRLGLTIQQALQTKFAGFRGILNCPNENSLARRFSRSFENCAGKDSLLIVKERGGAPSYFSFLGPDVPTIQLDTLQASPVAPTRPVPDEFREPIDGNLGDQEIAAKTIQKMWRIRYPILQKRREFLKTPKGRAVAYIGKLCEEIVKPTSLHPKEVIARRAVLFNQGLYLREYCQEIEEKYSEVKRKVAPRRKEAAKSKSMQQMQEFQFQWAKLSAMKKLIQDKAGILVEKNWEKLHVSSGVLGEKIDGTLKALRTIDADLEMIMEQNMCMALS